MHGVTANGYDDFAGKARLTVHRSAIKAGFEWLDTLGWGEVRCQSRMRVEAESHVAGVVMDADW